ncbi:MAG: YjbE family putative metal transport protein [Hyphomonadaceae bacterium]|nr:YjbE family putative metal transport protein [Hyphomonadaceae bacterium]
MEGLIASFIDVFNPDHAVTNFAALFQVILIDLALAGDNAVAVGLAASALPKDQRRRAIFWGIVLALFLRIAFASVTLHLLQIQGLLLVGGLLLFWVAWRMWSDLQHHNPIQVNDPAAGVAAAEAVGGKKPKTFFSALLTIVVADVSMSLDNVIAVAAVSRHNEIIMWFGLILSVILMGIAASIVARVIDRHRWIAVIGIIFIVFAGARMIWEDAHNFLPQYIPSIPAFLGGH